MLNVRQMQATLGVITDGVAGVQTWTALFERCGAKPERAVDLAIGANVHFPAYGVSQTALRLAHYMGQMMHESLCFVYMEEIASGRAYEGRQDLGNIHKGDGTRYKGRGPIQLTGRNNYRNTGRAIGIDLESNPTLASVPSIGIHTACHYWETRNLNHYADADQVREITRRINGGFNGLSDRIKYTNRMKKLLGIST